MAICSVKLEFVDAADRYVNSRHRMVSFNRRQQGNAFIEVGDWPLFRVLAGSLVTWK